MAWYLPLKLIHLLSATLLLGTGLGTAYYMWRADRSGDVRIIADTASNVVRADFWFIAPAVVIQPVTGYLMLQLRNLPLGSSWIISSVVLYAIVGACWLPVVWIQWRVARDAQLAARAGQPLPSSHRRLMRWWYALGWPAFIGVIAIYGLMVFKPVY